MPQLCLQVSRRQDAVHVAVIGRLERRTAAGFTALVLGLVGDAENGARLVVLDLRCCIHVDAAGAAALASVQQELALKGVRLRLRGMSPLTEDSLSAVSGISGASWRAEGE
jgi:anti-anti-sigma regulatory factor